MTTADWTVFARDIEEQLCPMFPGAILQSGTRTDQSSSSSLAACVGGYLGMKLRTHPPTSDYLLLERGGQPFTVDEQKIADLFCRRYNELWGVEGGDAYRPLMVAALPGEVVVARAAELGRLGDSGANALRGVIGLMTAWSSQTYEGAPISTAFVVENTVGGGASLADYEHIASACVLGDGMSSFWVVGNDARLARFETIAAPRSGSGYFPWAFRAIAEYTNKQSRVAAVLNRRGEILLFVGGSLVFAWRRAKWLYANHQAATTRWTGVHSRELRRAVYETCLDISYARTGAGIAVVRRADVEIVRSGTGLVNVRDVAGGANSKGETLRRMVGTKRFQVLPREMRMQLAAMDGSVVLATDGELLAAGAIVQIPAGSDGGGRLAAAKSLATYGFAVKVSSDGQVRAFNRGHQSGLGVEAYVGL